VADYVYPDEAARDAALIRLIQSSRVRMKQKAARKVERAALPARPVQVGDVFVRSWRYDQTNVDFYVVTSVTASGKSCTVRGCGKAQGDGRDMVKADPNAQSSKERTRDERVCRVSVGYRGAAMISIGGGDHASLDNGESHYETNPYEGH